MCACIIILDDVPVYLIFATLCVFAASVRHGGRSMQLGLIDTAGEETSHKMAQLSYPQADVFLVCFAVDSHTSLQSVEQVWVPEIRHHVGRDAKIILVGTKIDLRDDRDTLRQLKQQGRKPITSDEGRRMMRRLRLSRYVECSALTRKGLSNVFEETVNEIMDWHEPEPKQGFVSKLKFWKTSSTN